MEWKPLKILPLPLSTANAKVVEAVPGDGGRLRAILTMRQGVKFVQVSHFIDDPDSEAEARYPTFTEVFTALKALGIPDGTVMQMQFPSGAAQREPHGREIDLFMVAVGRLAATPTIIQPKGNGDGKGG